MERELRYMKVHTVRCTEHPEVIYDPRSEECPKCEEEIIQEVIDRLDRKEEEMVWE